MNRNELPTHELPPQPKSNTILLQNLYIIHLSIYPSFLQLLPVDPSNKRLLLLLRKTDKLASNRAFLFKYKEGARF